jgi:hypothetical protein
MRTPTEKQYGLLLMLGSGNAWITASENGRDYKSLQRHGWVDGFPMVRITPDGLQALAVAVETYGLPDLGPKLKMRQRVCSKCGGRSWRYEITEVEVPA